jgi:xylulokinase
VRIYGVPPLDSGADSLAHMRWFKLTQPEAYARTANFLEPMDYVTTRLTGRATTNPCSSFMMLLLDNRSLATPRWSPALLRLGGIDADKLPELLPVDAEIGTLLPEVAAALGVPASARVFGGVNDTQAGGVGAYALNGTHAGVSIGTTSVLVTHVDWKRTDILNALVSMPSPVPGAYLVTAENGIGGRAIEYFLKKVVFANDAYADHSLDDEFEALHRAIAGVPPGSDGVLFLPWLNGSLAPAEDGRVRGGFLNMSLDTTRAHLGRAVLEGVALNFRWMRRAVEKFCKRELSHLVFYGGGAVSSEWAQIFADVLNLPVHQVHDPRYTICRGVALLGFHHLGLVGLDDLERLVPIDGVFEPRADARQRYDVLFTQFVRAFKANRRIFHALNT